jgi:hypothetical protein
MHEHRSGVSAAPLRTAATAGAMWEARCRQFDQTGQPSEVLALRALLSAALADARNSKFVTVAPSAVPLRHPALVWSQLIAETHISRVRMRPAELSSKPLHSLLMRDLADHHLLPPGSSARLSEGDASVALTRMHAEIVAKDDHLWPFFEKYCRSEVRRRTPERHARRPLRMHARCNGADTGACM